MNSIECFKQALINDETHFLSIFIISCLYELLGFYKTAIQWFEICLDKKKFRKKVYFGLALSNFKLQQYEFTAKYLNKLFKFYQKETLRDEFVYLQILNLKKTNELHAKIINEYKYFKNK